jgi:hypothetical protein
MDGQKKGAVEAAPDFGAKAPQLDQFCVGSERSG